MDSEIDRRIRTTTCARHGGSFVRRIRVVAPTAPTLADRISAVGNGDDACETGRCPVVTIRAMRTKYALTLISEFERRKERTNLFQSDIEMLPTGERSCDNPTCFALVLVKISNQHGQGRAATANLEFITLEFDTRSCSGWHEPHQTAPRPAIGPDMTTKDRHSPESIPRYLFLGADRHSPVPMIAEPKSIFSTTDSSHVTIVLSRRTSTLPSPRSVQTVCSLIDLADRRDASAHCARLRRWIGPWWVAIVDRQPHRHRVRSALTSQAIALSNRLQRRNGKDVQPTSVEGERIYNRRGSLG